MWMQWISTSHCLMLYRRLSSSERMMRSRGGKMPMMRCALDQWLREHYMYMWRKGVNAHSAIGFKGTRGRASARDGSTSLSHLRLVLRIRVMHVACGSSSCECRGRADCIFLSPTTKTKPHRHWTKLHGTCISHLDQMT